MNFKDMIISTNIDIWHINISLESYKKHLDLVNILSMDEKIKAENFVFEKDRMSYTISHITLRLLLSYYLNIKPEKLSFDYNFYGKPSLSKTKILHFNLSHSNSKAVICFYKGQIGIDIEYINRSLEIEEVSTSVLSNLEMEIINKLSGLGRIIKFFDLWTKKEALIKAQGLSINEMKNIDYIELRAAGWVTLPFRTHSTDYIGNIAYKSDTVDNIRYYTW